MEERMNQTILKRCSDGQTIAPAMGCEANQTVTDIIDGCGLWNGLVVYRTDGINWFASEDQVYYQKFYAWLQELKTQ